MACPPVAQADTTAMLCPCAPVAIATCPVALSASMFDRKNGLSRRGPRSSNTFCWASRVVTPPTAEPMTTPVRGAVFGGDGVAAVGQRLLDGDQGELGVAVHVPHFFGVNGLLSKFLTSPANCWG